jgi:hypothetical protein
VEFGHRCDETWKEASIVSICFTHLFLFALSLLVEDHSKIASQQQLPAAYFKLWP